jgi:hypothetical protein
MGLLDKVKAGAEQAVSTGQRQAQIMQTKRELSHAYIELGKTAYGLVERGEVSHSDLTTGVDRIKELQARLVSVTARDGASADDGASAGADAADANGGEAVDADIVE